jgi:hypothetical protein
MAAACNDAACGSPAAERRPREAAGRTPGGRSCRPGLPPRRSRRLPPRLASGSEPRYRRQWTRPAATRPAPCCPMENDGATGPAGAGTCAEEAAADVVRLVRVRGRGERRCPPRTTTRDVRRSGAVTTCPQRVADAIAPAEPHAPGREIPGPRDDEHGARFEDQALRFTSSVPPGLFS